MCCFNNVKCNPGLLLFNHPVMSDSLCPMDCSMPGLSVLHHLLECAQGHIHCIGDAIQSSHPLTPSSSALNLSLHTLLAWGRWVQLSNGYTFRPGGLIFWCHIFLAFYTVHEVLTASILGWIAFPSCSGSRFVRTLSSDPSVLGGPARHGS